MVVSVVVGLWNMSILRLDGFLSMRSQETYRSIAFVCGVELYVCVYLVYVTVNQVRVCSFGVVYV
jgi:hypothetical protein